MDVSLDVSTLVVHMYILLDLVDGDYMNKIINESTFRSDVVWWNLMVQIVLITPCFHEKWVTNCMLWVKAFHFWNVSFAKWYLIFDLKMFFKVVDKKWSTIKKGL